MSSLLSNLGPIDHKQVPEVVAQRVHEADDVQLAKETERRIQMQMNFVACVLKIDGEKIRATFRRGDRFDEKGWNKTYSIFRRHLDARSNAQKQISRQRRIVFIAIAAIAVLAGLAIAGALPPAGGVLGILLATALGSAANSQRKMIIKERDRQDIQLFTTIPQRIFSRTASLELQEQHLKRLIQLSKQHKWEHSTLQDRSNDYENALNFFLAENGINPSFSDI